MNSKIVIGLICFVVAVGLAVFAISPLWSDAKILKTDIDGLAQETIEVENLLAKVIQLEQKYLESEEEARKVIWALPEGEDISYLLVQFEGLALQNGLLLEGIEFNQVKEGAAPQETIKSAKLFTGVSSLSVGIKASGSYEALKGYLNSLENNVRSIDIEQISFSAPERGKDGSFGQFGIFEFDLVIKVYYKPSI